MWMMYSRQCEAKEKRFKREAEKEKSERETSSKERMPRQILVIIYLIVDATPSVLSCKRHSRKFRQWLSKEERGEATYLRFLYLCLVIFFFRLRFVESIPIRSPF